MMLLIGMKMSFTKKPINPMIAKPIEVACAILENSVAGRNRRRQRSSAAHPWEGAEDVADHGAPVRSGFVQRFIRRHESRTNCEQAGNTHSSQADARPDDRRKPNSLAAALPADVRRPC